VTDELQVRRWLTCEQAAEYLQLHPQSVRGMIKRGEFGAGRLGRALRLDRPALDAYLEGQVRSSQRVGREGRR